MCHFKQIIISFQVIINILSVEAPNASISVSTEKILIFFFVKIHLTLLLSS